MKRWIIITTVVLAATSCGGGRAKTETAVTDPIPVTVQKIAFDRASKDFSYSGILEESTSLSLSFATAGTIEQVFVREGAKISKGDVLATLDKTSAQASFESAEAVLKQAEDGYRRMEQVYKEGAVTEVKWIEMQTDLAKARSLYTLAKKSLENCTLVSPADGWAGTVNAKAGTNIGPGMSAVVLLQTDRLIARFSVPEREITLFRPGQRAKVSVASTNQVISGTVKEVALKANMFNHTYSLTVDMPNPGNLLRPGMLCEIKVEDGNGVSKATVLPSNAVILDMDSSKFVWINEDGKAVRRKITVGDFTKGGIVVLSGLNEGDEVIIEGYQKVSEGMNIEVRNVK